MPLKDKKSLSLGAKTRSRGLDEDCCHRTGKSGEGSDRRPDLCSSKAPEKPPEVFSRRDSQGSNTDFPLSVNNSSGVSAKDTHAEDNQKHLAALEARRKAKELQKKSVHNALANLDGHPEDKPTHIIFGSSSESERGDIHSGAKPLRRGTGKSPRVEPLGSSLTAVMTRNLVPKVTTTGSELNLNLRAELDRSS